MTGQYHRGHDGANMRRYGQGTGWYGDHGRGATDVAGNANERTLPNGAQLWERPQSSCGLMPSAQNADSAIAAVASMPELHSPAVSPPHGPPHGVPATDGFDKAMTAYHELQVNTNHPPTLHCPIGSLPHSRPAPLIQRRRR